MDTPTAEIQTAIDFLSGVLSNKQKEVDAISLSLNQLTGIFTVKTDELESKLETKYTTQISDLQIDKSKLETSLIEKQAEIDDLKN